MKQQQRSSPPFGLALLTLAVAGAVQARNVDINTASGWNGTSSISAWGVANTATYGQTFAATASRSTLQDVTVYIGNSIVSGSVNAKAYVYAWDGSKATGPALYSSSTFTVPVSSQFNAYSFSTGGINLVENQHYVVFVSTSGLTNPTQGTFSWGTVNNAYSGGDFVYMNNAADSSLWTSSAWSIWNGDLAVNFTFNPFYGVYDAAVSRGNNPALGAAEVIDDHGNLLALFAGQNTDQKKSNAATQTLPMLTGASARATQSALSGINRVVETRTDVTHGVSSGDGFYGNNNLWMKPFGSWARQSDHNNVSGYRADTYGAVFGLDHAVTPELRLGGGFGYAKSNVDGKSAIAPQNLDVNVYQLIGYGSYDIDARTAVDFQADVGLNSNKGERHIAFTSSVAASDYNSRAAHIGVNLGRSYALGSKTRITPSVYSDYTWIRESAYRESGAGILNLNVSSRNTDSLVFGLKGKLAHELNDQTTLFANLGVGYDVLSRRDAITSTFAGAADATFVTYGADSSPWVGRAGVGLTYKIKSNLALTARYDAEYRENFLNQTASLKMDFAF